ncbi:tyrosine-type recombinase/integrase [Halobiforma nitratireducens]|uniref:Integrase domain-containing protein SAM domain-containing protein n=1 Tax=Halobiforma nitratireducens JCM 10879 TaxID=1227454 RepID=M0M9C4_9EURY|nr:tyrosine-type recombinase/integrase [Halobiforma nitratireducens]EMA41938.1 integrase domain-containing protein SAM domain-containing protein [Halobiforma nitratireducens JCM 10879]
MSLEPIDPETALDLYLTDRDTEVTQATLYSHSSRLSHFVRWCNQQGIDNLNELTGRKMQEYRLWRREDGDLSPASEKTQMDTVRVFVKYLESIDAVEEDLHVKVRSPQLTGKDNVRDVMLEQDRAEEILDYLEKYEYASRPHVLLTLLWHTMMRVGAAHALDVDDYDPDDQLLEVHHRPDTGTPIKNQAKGERLVAVSDDVCSLLDDWIATRRPEVTDEYGRKPLLATREGRAHKGTLRGDCYQYTRPCIATGNCPHDRDQDTCTALDYEHAYDCPSSVSPHALRRGGITYALNQEWPAKAVSNRANVSESVIDEHYDRRTKREKMEQRRQYLENI